MNIQDSEIPKTFITTIRVDARDIAAIALFLEENKQQDFQKSRSKIASLAVRMMAEQLPRFRVEGTSEAIQILQSLGYGQILMKGRRDYIPLLRQLAKESQMENTSISYQQAREMETQKKIQEDTRIIGEQMIQIQQAKTNTKITPAEIAKLPGIRGILEVDPDAKTEIDPERKIHIPAGAPKNKIHAYQRTKTDEEQNLNQLRTGLTKAPMTVEEG